MSLDSRASGSTEPESWTLDTPVVIILFNRPEKTRRVFEQIAKVEPGELFVIADGPRAQHPDDEEKCHMAREVIDEVDWDCQVHWDFADENLGVEERVQTGLDWVFENVDEAIILEDDCLPDPSFFPFCQELLGEYREDERIWDVTGTNPLLEWNAERYDYHYSIHGVAWGWATWKRSWERYDPDMERWADPDIRARVRDYLADAQQYRWARRLYERTFRGEETTWDYQWGFAKSINNALSIVPSRNLVSNIGFDEGATHTTATDSPLADLPRQSIEFPIDFNDFVAVDRTYSRRYFEYVTTQWERNRLLRRLRTLYFWLRAE